MDEYPTHPIGDGTYVSLRGSRTRVRGGGYGSSAWIALIVGAHPTYHFDRQFCRANRDGLSGSGRSGVITFRMQGPGLYEYRGFCSACTRIESGFLLIEPDGMVERISRTRAMALAAAMDAVTTDSDAQASGARAITTVGGAPAYSPTDEVDAPAVRSTGFRP